MTKIHKYKYLITAYLVSFFAVCFTLLPIIWLFMLSIKSKGETFTKPPKLVFDPTINTSSKYFNVSIRGSDGLPLSAIQTGKEETVSAYVSPGTYYAWVQSDTFYNSENYTVSAAFSAGSAFRESERNETKNEATSITLGEFYTAQLYSDADVDYYSFPVDQAGTIDLTFRTPSDTNSKYYNN